MTLMKAATGSAPRTAPSPEITGVVVTVEPAYPREVGIGWHIILPVLAAAGVTQLLMLLIATITRSGGSGGGQRSVGQLRKGPEFLVTEFTVRQDDGTLVELEIHGHLAKSALLPGDRVRAWVRRQRRRDLPPRAHRLHNNTSGRVHRPHAPTKWSHIGMPLLPQAFLGLTIVLLIAIALLLRRL
jgi:hypothetical protein